VFGQKTNIYTNGLATYNSALELYDKEKFSAAQEKFTTYLKTVDDKKSEVAVNSTYYHAICGLELFNINAENLLIEFINTHPESPKVKLAYHHLARYKFRKKKYDEALEWYQKMDIYDLTNEEQSEYYFKIGYSNFKEDNFVNASAAFYEIKDTDNKFSSTAKYYYAHISYLQKKYESALQTFKKLEEDEKFAVIVPYYITQIYYLQKKYNKVIEYAPSLLAKSIPKRSAEIARLLGESYYNTNQFNAAIPYLKRYHKEKPYNASRSDKYQLGYAYYKSDSCDLAIKWFKKAVKENDSLSQTAHYNLAECYLKTNQKTYARGSFRVASNIDFDPQIKEDALFSFAKISYELSMRPYNGAIVAFEEFINTYPNSTKLENAYEFLIAVYYTTKNYQAALNSLGNINVLDLKLQEAYQKIAHYRGLELFNNRKYPEAIIHFDKSDIYIISKKIKAENSYWRAEANYRINNYEIAIGEYNSYIFEPEAIAANTINKAHYSLGYSYFKLKEYSNANQSFRKYIQNAEDEHSKTKNDALNRVADCFFINKQYQAAIEYYDKAAMLGIDKIDYSLYQSAVTNGVIGNYKDKENLLQTLINRKKKSYLLDDAIFQLGKTQEIGNHTDKALANFQRLIKDHPNSPYLSEALIKEGLIFYNKKDDTNALISFERVIKDYPSTDESTEALKQIKKIHIDKGELALYEEYLTSIGDADSSAQVMDDDYYEVAENSYMSGNCEKATTDLTNYLEKYPNGNSILSAHFYRADCENRSGFENEALIDFNYVIAQPKNKFTITALIKAGEINLSLGKPAEALENYSKLEYLADVPKNVFDAQIAQMRLNYKLNNPDQTVKYCELIINRDIDDALLITEAHLIYAKTGLIQDDYNLALTEFATAAGSSNKFGAEAKFNVAKILNLRSEYDNCEVEIFSLIKKFQSYAYWIDKSLLLLADNYFAKEDMFQSKLTLQNIIEKNRFPEVVSLAIGKLAAIEATEVEEEIVEEEIEIELFNQDEFKKLFEEDEEFIEEKLPKLPETIEEQGNDANKEVIKQEPKEETEDIIEEAPKYE